MNPARRLGPRWSFVRIGDSSMFRVNPYFFYDFGRAMQMVIEWSHSSRLLDDRALNALETVDSFLKELMDADDFPMPQSSVPAAKIRALLELTLKNKTMGEDTKNEINKAILKFQYAYDAELGTSDFFQVPQIGIYSGSGLLTKAHRHLHTEVLVALAKLAPSATIDYALAGRALAFDLNTACGFHALRSVEAVARSYHMVVKGRSAVVEQQPLSAVIKELRDHMASSKGNKHADMALSLNVELLSKIDRIFRCPIMHPEMTLDSKKAKDVFDLSASVISSMVEDIKTRVTSKGAKP
jgi:hypothetical protein